MADAVKVDVKDDDTFVEPEPTPQQVPSEQPAEEGAVTETVEGGDENAAEKVNTEAVEDKQEGGAAAGGATTTI